MKRIKIPMSAPILFLASPAFAEVADKEPSTLQLYFVPAVITCIAFIVAMKRPFFALFLFPISCFCAWGVVGELRDPFVGPAIRDELGEAYFTHGYLSAALGMAGPLIAWAAHWLYRSRAKR